MERWRTETIAKASWMVFMTVKSLHTAVSLVPNALLGDETYKKYRVPGYPIISDIQCAGTITMP